MALREAQVLQHLLGGRRRAETLLRIDSQVLHPPAPDVGRHQERRRLDTQDRRDQCLALIMSAGTVFRTIFNCSKRT